MGEGKEVRTEGTKPVGGVDANRSWATGNMTKTADPHPFAGNALRDFHYTGSVSVCMFVYTLHTTRAKAGCGCASASSSINAAQPKVLRGMYKTKRQIWHFVKEGDKMTPWTASFSAISLRELRKFHEKVRKQNSMFLAFCPADKLPSVRAMSSGIALGPIARLRVTCRSLPRTPSPLIFHFDVTATLVAWSKPFAG